MCPRCCLCFHQRCLPPPLPLLATDVIGDGSDCGNSCGGNGGSGNDGACRSFSGVMFKILHITSNILNIKLDKEGGGRRMDVATAVTMRATTATTAVTTAVAKAAVAAATVAMATVCDNGNEGNEAAAVEGAGGRGQWFAAAAPVAMASAANSGNGGGRQQWP